MKKRIYSLHHQNVKLKNWIIIAGIVSFIVFVAIRIFSNQKPLYYTAEMNKAAQLMERAINEIREYRFKNDMKIDKIIDPNQTGLIGPEFTELTTTLGHLDAKRTTTNPNIAGLIVYLLRQAGVESGDTIAIGCSASFPALMVGSMAAAEVMDLFPVIIISLGASLYGATDPDFNLLDIYNLLLKKAVFTVSPAAISLGGEKDVGENYGPELKKKLTDQIKKNQISFIDEPDLQKNVKIRMKIYNSDLSENTISAFINCGGSYANLGTSNLVLKLKPGLNKKMALPPQENRGMVFEMAGRNIPIIHLLFIKGLVLKYGLPWDPAPLPKPDN